MLGAAAVERDADQRLFAHECFSGKIGDLQVSVGQRQLLRIDFSKDVASSIAVDVSGNGHHAQLFNAPARAVTGHDWRGADIDYRRAPEQWNAVHFHEDDLEDAGWPPAAHIALPRDLPSGVYAVRLRGNEAEDRVPFFVLPPKSRAHRPAVAFLAPTFTYQAYGNARLSERIDYQGSGLSERPYTLGVRDDQAASRPEVSGSLYDVHSDGSGRCYVTALRPIFNFRADYRSPVQQAPRHLGGDLYLTSWLEHLNQEYDVLTDGALDEEGVGLLSGYRVLITGSHPEYVSSAILDALDSFVAEGGRIMYLGANGFYWVTSRDSDRPHILECRRGHAGTRTWESQPGETHHSTSGEPGGLWRHRGRAPNNLFGVGMASQGWDLKAPGYRRTPESFQQEVSWIFEGIPDEGIIGDAGLVMDGASGDELDRYDTDLGSPPDAVVVATSLPHSRYYKPVIEDVPMLVDGLDGDQNEEVRSDVVYCSRPAGGAVFSVGSIAWAGAMAFNDFDNDVARMTRNVLERFIASDDGGGSSSQEFG